MTKRRGIGITVSLLSLLFLIWLLWPRTFAQTMPGFQEDRLTSIRASLFGMDEESRIVILDPASPSGRELLSLMKSTRFQRVLTLRDTRTITLDYEIRLSLAATEGEVTDFFWISLTGDSLIDVGGSGFTSRPYAAHGSQEFQQRVLDFLLAQEYEPMPNG